MRPCLCRPWHAKARGRTVWKAVLIIAGLHHITAIATDPARNLRFYTGLLGLRLIKRTVTHEDPGAYHLIYAGGPGASLSRLSFFSWTSAAKARHRPDDSEYIAFSIASDALDWWATRLDAAGIPIYRGIEASGSAYLAFADPDLTPLRLIGQERPSPPPQSQLDIPDDKAIRALDGVRMSLRGVDPMSELLQQMLGFAEASGTPDLMDLRAHNEAGGWFGLHRRRGSPRPRIGAGTIHHVAFRVADEAALAGMAVALKDRFKIDASPVKDRYYFRSIYFRGPDGLLIEISTDGPGFLIDETEGQLGKRLIFPPGLKDREAELLRILPPL